MTAISANELPSLAEVAAFRGYLQGIDPRTSVTRYAASLLTEGRNARGVIGDIRRALVAAAHQRHRLGWAVLFGTAEVGIARATLRRLDRALAELRAVPLPSPQLDDSVGAWLPERTANALVASGIRTLAELIIAMNRRRMWWRGIGGLGKRSALRIAEFYEVHPTLAKQAATMLHHLKANTRSPWQTRRVAPANEAENNTLNVSPSVMPIPWANAQHSKQFDGSQGRLRAPKRGCLLDAKNDYEAVNTWLDLQENASTKRAYRKEIERLMLWSIVEQQKPLSSLSHEDAVAYRGFLRRPSPASRWIGPVVSRHSLEWRPFQGSLSAKSAAYALSVLSSLFRWLTEQRYLVGNPFASVTIKASKTERSKPGETPSYDRPRNRAFTDREWQMIRRWADRAETQLGWRTDAAGRLRFILDFTLGTGLRIHELANATLRDISIEVRNERWISVLGKGNKRANVALPPLAWEALKRELRRRGIGSKPDHWAPRIPLVVSVEGTGNQENQREDQLTAGRIWAILRRFFDQVADGLEAKQPTFAEKLRAATPHWLRHSHATMALDAGAELTSVRENLRHASVNTTSNYLHAEESKRARQIGRAFGRRV